MAKRVRGSDVAPILAQDVNRPLHRLAAQSGTRLDPIRVWCRRCAVRISTGPVGSGVTEFDQEMIILAQLTRDVEHDLKSLIVDRWQVFANHADQLLDLDRLVKKINEPAINYVLWPDVVHSSDTNDWEILEAWTRSDYIQHGKS